MASHSSYPSISEQLHTWLGLFLGPKPKRAGLQAKRELLDFMQSIWNALVFQRAGWLPGALDTRLNALASSAMPPGSLVAFRTAVQAQLEAEPFDDRVVLHYALTAPTRGMTDLRVASIELEQISDLEPALLAHLGLRPQELALLVQRRSLGAGAQRGGSARDDRSGPSAAASSASSVTGAKTGKKTGKRTSKRAGESGSSKSKPATAVTGELNFPEPDGLPSKDASEVVSSATKADHPKRQRKRSKPATRRDPTAIAWGDLYRMAAVLSQHAPWTWLNDGHVFGIRFPDEKESYWCVVMGANGEFYGVAAYRGDHGFDCLRRLRESADEQVGLLGYDGYLFSWGDREDLTAEELAAIHSSGVPFRGRGAWPRIKESRYGRMTRPIDVTGIPQALRLLQAIYIAAHILQQRAGEVSDWFDAELPHFEVRAEDYAETRIRPAPPAPPVQPALDQIGIRRLQQNCLRTQKTFEYDLCVVPGRVEDGQGWLFPPLMSILVDAKSGHVLATKVDPPDKLHEVCAKNLISQLEKSGTLPRHLHVSRPWILKALSPTASALGLELSLRRELPALSDFRDSLEDWMGSDDAGR